MSQSPDPNQLLDHLLQSNRGYPLHTLSDEDRAEAQRLETLLQEKSSYSDQKSDLHTCALKFNLYMIYTGQPRLKYNN